MHFQSLEVEQFYHRVMAIPSSLPEAERPVLALMDAYGWFRLIHGEHDERVQEIIQHLLSPDLRPALRHWYRRHKPSESNVSAIELHAYLSQRAREKLGG